MVNACEVITYWVGQCGIQMGDASWELLCLEHEMDPNGTFHNGQIPEDTSFKHFFQEGVNNQFIPRTIFADLEPTVVDEIRTGVYRNLFHPDYIINYYEDASNNFARAFYGKGKHIIGDVVKATRKIAEACDMIQALIVNHSYGGGTGSGFISMIMAFLSIEYSKTSKIQLGVFPSPTLSTSIVEPYNGVLAIHSPMENSDISMFIDNEALFNICQYKLNIDSPVFTNLNRIIAQVFSGITAGFRFEGPSNTKLADLQTNLVPYPRIHFPSLAFSPIDTPFSASHDYHSTKEITFDVLSKESQLLMADLSDGINMSCVLLYRGDINSREISSSLIDLKKSKKILFFDWIPTGFKTGINYQPMTLVPPSGMAFSTRSVTMLSNSTSIKSIFTTINRKFLMIFNKRAFVHWYISEGMEEGEFHEAYENVMYLEQDFKILEDSQNPELYNAETQSRNSPNGKPVKSKADKDQKFTKTLELTKNKLSSSIDSLKQIPVEAQSIPDVQGLRMKSRTTTSSNEPEKEYGEKSFISKSTKTETHTENDESYYSSDSELSIL